MAGRKLTRQQAFRIKKVQEERLARAQKKAEKLEAGVEGDAQPGVVITRHGASAEVAAMQALAGSRSSGFPNPPPDGEI